MLKKIPSCFQHPDELGPTMSGDLLKVPSLEVPCYSLPERQQGWRGTALGTQRCSSWCHWSDGH